MEREEKVIKLMNKTGACREDVENALNACGDDILDAAMYLEALGKVNPMAGMASSVNTQNTPNGFTQAPYGGQGAYNGNANQGKNGGSIASGIGKVLGKIGELIKKGLENYLDIYNENNCIFSIPITVLVLLFIPFFWLMLVLGIVFLFMGYRYEFRGPNCKKEGSVNQALNKASDTCKNVKEDFMHGYNDGKGNQQ